MTEPATPQYVAGIGIGYVATLALVVAIGTLDVVPTIAVQLALVTATIGAVYTVATDDHIQAWRSDDTTETGGRSE